MYSLMKSPFHHLRYPEQLFDHFHQNLHHAFALFALAIIWMLRGASHILTPTSASRQWWGFITSDFRDQHPSSGNITYALFGDGTPGSTAYTRLRSSSCVPTNVQVLPSSFSGWAGNSNTIYILNPGTYTLTSPISFNSKSCSAIIGTGDVIIKESWSNIAALLSSSNIIIDNIKFNGQISTSMGIQLSWSSDITLNNIDAYQNTGYGIYMWATNNISLYNSRFYNNTVWVYPYSNTTINNSQFFNNSEWIYLNQNYNISINNSQIYNNTHWIRLGYYAGPPFGCVLSICFLLSGCSTIDFNNSINNSIIYDNNQGIYADNCWTTTDWTHDFTHTYNLNNTKIYNNNYWIISYSGHPDIKYYSTLQFFANSNNTGWTNILSQWISSSIPSWTDGQLDEATIAMDYDQVTNPQNGSGKWLLSGTNRNVLTGVQWFDVTKQPIRYIFWGNILKQITPVWYDSSTLTEYGNDGADYTTTRYIAEPESSLSATQQLLVNQYFWSGSIYTQNRQTNGCSLSAFQVKTLTGGIFNATNNKFEDHTIYILTGGEYKSTATGNAFVFNGNCIALIGADNTIFTKTVANNSMFYANNKRNIIIDNIKVDGTYIVFWNIMIPNNQVPTAIEFDGASNNNTFNNVQVYNNSQYGIYLGLLSHHNTIINAQLFNNGIAGMYLYYASNYNVINNTQIYNNGTYGIRFANGSSRNTMNNFQAYNNGIWVFWDLTTQENILNRAAIYNNSTAGIYFKNSSGNMLNDVRVYNNAIGIRTLYSSMGNKYYGDLKLSGNWSDFDGTSGNDSYLAPGSAGLFPYGWTLTTGTNMASCLYATNPTLSGTIITLLNTNCNNTWFNAAFQSPSDTYVNYMFWLNMYKQKVPVRYDSGNTLVQIPSQYDPTKYIAELFAIRDTTPEGVSFLWSGSAELNTWYTTEVYTAGTVNIPVLATLFFDPLTTSGYLIISGVNTGLTWMVNNGDTIQIKLLTRTGYNETTTGMITIWTVTTWFTVKTRWVSQTPTTWSFAFANLTSIPVNTFTGSTVTVAGIETGVTASIIFSPLTTSGRLEIYSWGTLVSSGTTWFVYNGNQVKAIAQSSSGLSQTVTGIVTIGLGTGVFTIMTKWFDVTPPSTPTITYPLSGEELFFITFQWTASTDTGSGIEGYVYEISDDSNFTDIINTWFIETVTGTTGSPTTEFDANNDTYYWKIQARDRDGNTWSRSNTWSFKAVDFDSWDFNEKTNANLRTDYDSEEITLEGIKPGLSVWASIDGNGTLYKNGTDKGTGTFVQNGDDLYVTVRSSNRYDKTVSSLLTIANRSLEFAVTTKQESDNACTLSDDDKTMIQTIYDSLVQNYSGDENKFDEFLNTMQSMLNDEIDFSNDCNLQYLEDLINSELGTNLSGTVTTGTRIAPNCKEYPISFDNVRIAYTSPTFKVITYFANHDSLTRYIDSKNPGDCHINTYGVSSWIFSNTDPSKHIAPNGKVYIITSDSQWYTSTDFAVTKYFSTNSALSSYIDSKNLPQEIRSHQVDTNFTPQTYIAPNGKDYTIYKTDRWYMSYKLMKVRYFSTLADIQYFISHNNQK